MHRSYRYLVPGSKKNYQFAIFLVSIAEWLRSSIFFDVLVVFCSWSDRISQYVGKPLSTMPCVKSQNSKIL
jgi:hypothetical protein